MSVMAVDPGTTQSAYVEFDGQRVLEHGIFDNATMLTIIRDAPGRVGCVVFERVASYGMPVGEEVFATVFWTGRFAQVRGHQLWQQMFRREVKMHLCGSQKAKDANIRQALLDRFGGPSAIGVKAKQGPLYGLRSHEFAALAICVTWWDLNVTKAGM